MTKLPAGSGATGSGAHQPLLAALALIAFAAGATMLIGHVAGSPDRNGPRADAVRGIAGPNRPASAAAVVFPPGRTVDRRCEPVRQQANGVGLPLAPARVRARLQFGDTVSGDTCAWTVGEPISAGAKSYTVYLSRTPNDQFALHFLIDGETELGRYRIAPWDIRLEGREIVFERYGASARLSIGPSGPPAHAEIDGEKLRFEFVDPQLAMRQALSEPLGSRRESSPCGRTLRLVNGDRLRRADERVREVLARNGFPHELLDGAACIWRAGSLRGEDGRRYDLYWHEVEWGASTPHITSRLLVFSSSNRFVGGYTPRGVSSFRVRGHEFVFDDDGVSGGRIRFGRHGPPERFVMNGRNVVIERPRPEGR